ncbi:copper resistance protein CopC [Candidatus Parcubacteria bacterium]|nr:copper resistance protein CopC [Candidatus Parcubacteria bacterium]
MSRLIKIILSLIVIAGIGLAGWLVLDKDKTADNNQSTTQPSQTTTTDGFTFENPKKSAHYESNTPAHSAALAGVPTNVVIDFNFDLAEPSSISITSNGEEYGTADTMIDQNKLSMRRTIDSQAPDGLYTINYNACWPDGSCHDGSFQFAVDSKLAADFTDLRGQKEITIHMSDIKFNPANIRISSGTKITWVNNDGVDHFVNTDSHPAHTYLPGMNSRSLPQGASYSFTFSENGFYPYHCSAHASTMSGAVLVE